jgi:tRNA G18 (ribose-2'-O)-methylase SpoU
MRANVASATKTESAAPRQDSEGIPRKRIPKLYLVITNISKRPNIRALLELAAAFGCDKVLVVGQQKFDISPKGTDIPRSIREHVERGGLHIERYSSWEACINFLSSHGIRLVGVEIHVDARPIEAYLDYKDTAFLMGNEGQGINEKHMKSCDAFVTIPQYGGGTASLNVYVAASIVLHSFHQWQQGEFSKHNSS